MPPRARGQQGQDVVVHPSIEDSGGIAPFLGKYLTPIARIVPSHVNPEAFIALTLAYVNRDPKLLQAAMVNPQSLVYAMRMCAVLGHLPVRGQFAFVPFNNMKAHGGKEVVGIEEYRGVIERMFRAGGVTSVHAEVVREKDEFRRDRRPGHIPVHEYDDRMDPADRGRLDGVYAYATLHTGHLSQVVWMNRATVKKHRDASRSGDAFWGPWEGPEAPWAEDMWLKTGLHGLERWVPTSAAYRWEVSASTAAATDPKTGFPADVTNRLVRPAAGDDAADPDGDIVDAVIVPDGPSQPDSGASGEPWPNVAPPGGGSGG